MPLSINPEHPLLEPEVPGLVDQQFQDSLNSSNLHWIKSPGLSRWTWRQTPSSSTLVLAVKTTPRALPSGPLQEELATTLFPQATWGLGRTRNGQREREQGNLPPDSVMRSQFLSSLSRTATRVVQILQRPKWAASQVSLRCSRCGLSKAQWSVTTATMASTPPTRMKKRVTRTFRVLVCDMTPAEVWVLWAGGSSVSQG